ncbi:MAG: IPT/TIG domain-containing protein [Deltaproteobacteria bacterium]|nr:IPT/TIG domain-containing protein [Deltaproteobacteria bacterium]
MPDRRARVIGFALALVSLLALGACTDDKKLKVFGLEPNTGDFNGGQTVRIKGNGFQADGNPLAVKVYFGNRQASVIRFDGDADLYVTAPGGKKGEVVDVLVIFQPGGESRLVKAFTYVEPATTDVDDLAGSGSGSGK